MPPAGARGYTPIGRTNPNMAEKKIRITAGRVTADAVLNASKMAAAVWDALPLDIPGETWGDEIRPASPVNVFGRVLGDPTVFKSVRSGTKVRVERA